MDAKVTLSFDKEVIESAKKFADAQNISLSRLTEMLYRQIISGNYRNLEELPISNWVLQLAEGKAEYKKKPVKKKEMKKRYFDSRK